MGARLRSLWQRIKEPLELIIVSAFLIGLVVLIILIILGYRYNWNWTGLGPVNSEPKQHMKTLWDWLQLLIIPAVLAVGGYLFNLTVSRNEQKSTQLRDQTERDIAQDNQREAALQEYINKMSELLLDRKLRESTEDAEVRTIARVRTLTVLRGLDAIRKASLLQFLYESDLIDKNNPIIDLSGANFSGADLRRANLNGANLNGVNLNEAKLNMAHLLEANLSRAKLNRVILFGASLSRANLLVATLDGADLRQANLDEATLNGTDLIGANLRGVNLEKADLRKALVTSEQLAEVKTLQGATMPDGSIHP